MDFTMNRRSFLRGAAALGAAAAAGLSLETAAMAEEAAPTTDRIVIGTPLRDLTFPAMLRIYIEYICVREVTYHYENGQEKGDCMATKLAYLSVSGGPEPEENLGVTYWRKLCERFGIREFHHVDAYGLDIEPERSGAIMAQACEKARALAREF